MPRKDQLIPRALVGDVIRKPRGRIEYVVEEAGCPGGNQYTTDDLTPHSWVVIARRLNPDGTYDPKGKIILFDMDGHQSGIDVIPEVRFVRKMKKILRFE